MRPAPRPSIVIINVRRKERRRSAFGPLAPLVLLALLPTAARAQDDEALPPVGPPGVLALEVARELAGEIGPRPAGSEGAARGLDAVAARWRAAGLEPHAHGFDAVACPAIRVGGSLMRPAEDTRWLGGRGRNLWVSIPGESSEVVLVGGHIDSEGPDVPGARDDAAAVGLVVETAARLAARARREGPPPRTRVFCVFEGEERGLLGSRAFARDAPGGPVVFALSLDVVGTHGLALNGVGPTIDRAHAAAMTGAARRTGVDLVVPVPHLVFSRAIPQGERSDHGPFARNDVAAFHLFARGDEGFDPCYHTPLDAPGRLDPRALADTARLVDAFIEDLDRALDAPTDDGAFLPVHLPDPLGFTSGSGPWLLPGAVARGFVAVALLVGLGGIVAGGWRALRRPSGLGVLAALRSLALLELTGAAAGTAFVAPFLAASVLKGEAAPWHAPFDAYAAAGAASVATVVVLVWILRPLARRIDAHELHVSLGILGGLLVAGALVAVGVPEVAAIPATIALGLGAGSILASRPRFAAAASLLAFPGVIALTRPGLYRDGALTQTFPETGRIWLLAAAAAGAGLAPVGIALGRFLRDGLLGRPSVDQTSAAASPSAEIRAASLAARRVPWGVGLILPIVVALAAASLSIRATARASHDPGAPRQLVVHHRIDADAGREALVLSARTGAIPASARLLVDGRSLDVVSGASRAERAFEGEAALRPVEIAIAATRPDPRGDPGLVEVEVAVRPAPGAPPIDRIVVDHWVDRATRWELADGSGEAAVSADEPFRTSVFGAETVGGDGPRTRWRFRSATDALQLRVRARVFLADSPRRLELQLDESTTARRYVYVTASRDAVVPSARASNAGR